MTADAARKPLTKTEIISTLMERTHLEKSQVSAVLEGLTVLIKEGLEGPGSFTLPGLVKIDKKDVPAKPARTGVPNPFKPGELMDVAAKPASSKISVRALKQLKDMAK
jgi:nucleoid DNA-binding protein